MVGPSDSESGECEEDDATSSNATSAYIATGHDTYTSTSTILRSLSPTDMMFGDMDFLSNNLGVHFESESNEHTVCNSLLCSSDS